MTHIHAPFRASIALFVCFVVGPFFVLAQTVDVPLLYKNALKSAEEHQRAGLANVQNVYNNEIRPVKAAYDAALASAKQKKVVAQNAAQTFYNGQLAVAETLTDTKLRTVGRNSARSTFTASKRLADKTYQAEIKTAKALFEQQKKIPTDKLAVSKRNAVDAFNAKKSSLDLAFKAYTEALAAAERAQKATLQAPEVEYAEAMRRAEDARTKTITDAEQALAVAKRSAQHRFDAEKQNAEQSLLTSKQRTLEPYAQAKKAAEDNFRITTGLYR